MKLHEIQSYLYDLGCKGRQFSASFKEASSDGRQYAISKEELTAFSKWLQDVREIAVDVLGCPLKDKYFDCFSKILNNGVVNLGILEYITKHLNTTEDNLLKCYERMADSVHGSKSTEITV